MLTNILSYLNFNFTVPPEQPEILGYLNASTIALSPDENQLIMSCEVRKGHPAATIEWFRNGNLVVENVRYSSEPVTSGSKLMTARSTITISNIGDHHNSIYMCRAKNDALGNNWMQTFVKLNVLCKTLENLSISIKLKLKSMLLLNFYFTCYSTPRHP